MKVNNSTKNTNEEKISRDIYERMFDANPNLKELIDKLNLSPTNIGEDGIDDFEDYLIRKDLPF